MSVTEDDLIERARRFLGLAGAGVSDETLRPSCRRALGYVELGPATDGLDWEVGVRTIAAVGKLCDRLPGSRPSS